LMDKKEWNTVEKFYDAVSNYVLDQCPYPTMTLEQLRKILEIEGAGARCRGCKLSRLCDIMDNLTEILYADRYVEYWGDEAMVKVFKAEDPLKALKEVRRDGGGDLHKLL